MKSLGTLFLAVAILIGSTAGADAVVWTTNQHEYTLVILPGESWDAATLNMQSTLGAGWYLATITTKEENDFVYNTLVVPAGGSEYWIGGVQDPISTEDPSANWKWVTNELFTYQNWAGGEPNDGYGPGSEQWLAMWAGGGSWMSWNDEGNYGNITGYIAEKSPVPEPSAMLLLGSGLLGLVGYGRRRMK